MGGQAAGAREELGAGEHEQPGAAAVAGGAGGAGHEEATEPPHKHHLSMTGFVGGGVAKGTGSMHSGGASGSGIPRREHGKTLEDIKKKLQMMKQMHSNLNTE